MSSIATSSTLKDSTVWAATPSSKSGRVTDSRNTARLRTCLYIPGSPSSVPSRMGSPVNSPCSWHVKHLYAEGDSKSTLTPKDGLRSVPYWCVAWAKGHEQISQPVGDRWAASIPNSARISRMLDSFMPFCPTKVTFSWTRTRSFPWTLRASRPMQYSFRPLPPLSTGWRTSIFRTVLQG